jgi:DNA polymerase-3 subunit epsilon
MSGTGRNAEWCVVDLETTGLYPFRHDHVIEIALIAVDHVGNSIDELEALCTMHLASQLGIARSLEDCCVATGIENSAPHMAIGDARETAELFADFLKLQARGEAWPKGVNVQNPVVILDRTKASGRTLTRKEAASRAMPRSYLSRLVGKLPTPKAPTGAALEAVANYIERFHNPRRARKIEQLKKEEVSLIQPSVRKG